MSTLETALLVLQLLIAFALISVILFQRTAQDGGGLVGGGNTMGGLFTARGSANVLTRTTAFLAAAFILNSLALGFIASNEHQNRNLFDQVQVPAPKKPAPTAETLPAAPPTPVVPTGMPPVTSPAANAPVPAATTPGIMPTPAPVPAMPVPLTPDVPKAEPDLPRGPTAPEPADQ